MKRLIFIGCAILLSIIVSSCSSTKIISSWNARSIPSYAFDKVLVMAIMTDREVQDNTERAMTSELRKHNVNAFSAFDLFGPKKFNGLSEQEIFSMLKKSGYTSVMIVSLLDKEKETRYVPGSYYYPAYYPGSMHFYRRYWSIYGNVYTPGYFTSTTKYILEASVYALNDDDDDLIYSVQTRTIDPSDVQNLARDFSKSIADELHAKGLIQ